MPSAAAAIGPQPLLARVAREHGAYLHGYARHLCRVQADADDLVQDALVAALVRARPMAADLDLRAWLTTVMRHRFIDGCRRRQTRRTLVAALAVAPPTTGDEAAPWWLEVALPEVLEHVRALPPELATPFTMFALERASYRAIAAALAIPVVTVGTRIARARARLRARLSAARAAALA